MFFRKTNQKERISANKFAEILFLITFAITIRKNECQQRKPLE